jgi:hypothetical protein
MRIARRWSNSAAAAAFSVLAIVLSSAPARADITKDQCVDANGKAQDLRRDGKLSAAREQLQQCASAACPGIVRDDCAKRLDDLDKVQPTIVFDVKDAAGHDVVAVSVQMDGRALADKLTGSALLVDPGEHVFVFTAPGQPAVTQTFVLKEGDKERREAIVIGSAPTSGGQPAGASSSPTTPSDGASSPDAGRDRADAGTAHGMGTRKILGLVLAGAGVGGIALGSAFGVMTLSAVSDQKTDCPSSSNCPHPDQASSDHKSALNDRTVSTVSFIAGGVLLVGGAALFLTGGTPTVSPSASKVLLVPSVGQFGGGMLMVGRF